MLSPLQLGHVVLEEISIVRGDPLRGKSRGPRVLRYRIGVDYRVARKRRKGAPPSFDVLLSVMLEVARPRRGAPVKKVEGSLRGMFSFAPGVPDDLVSRLVPANCLAVLYGILRGLVLQDTGVCPGGGFLLPMLDMHEVVRQKEAGESVTASLKAAVSELGNGTGERRLPSPSRPKRR